MKKIIGKYKQIIMYLIFGALTTLVNILCFYILDKIGINTYINNTISWLLAVLFAFITNKLFVFESNKKDSKTYFSEGSKFLLSRIFSYFVDMGTIFLLLDIIHLPKMISKIISNIIVVIINYILSKLIVFKKNV